MAWRLTCAGQPQALAQAEPGLGSRPWRAQVLVFTVPTGGCSGQWLQLAGVGSADAGQVIIGDLWVAGMKVTTAGAR